MSLDDVIQNDWGPMWNPKEKSAKAKKSGIRKGDAAKGAVQRAPGGLAQRSVKGIRQRGAKGGAQRLVGKVKGEAARKQARGKSGLVARRDIQGSSLAPGSRGPRRQPEGAKNSVTAARQGASRIAAHSGKGAGRSLARTAKTSAKRFASGARGVVRTSFVKKLRGAKAAGKGALGNRASYSKGGGGARGFSANGKVAKGGKGKGAGLASLGKGKTLRKGLREGNKRPLTGFAGRLWKGATNSLRASRNVDLKGRGKGRQLGGNASAKGKSGKGITASAKGKGRQLGGNASANGKRVSRLGGIAKKTGVVTRAAKAAVFAARRDSNAKGSGRKGSARGDDADWNQEAASRRGFKAAMSEGRGTKGARKGGKGSDGNPRGKIFGQARRGDRQTIREGNFIAIDDDDDVDVDDFDEGDRWRRFAPGANKGGGKGERRGGGGSGNGMQHRGASDRDGLQRREEAFPRPYDGSPNDFDDGRDSRSRRTGSMNGVGGRIDRKTEIDGVEDLSAEDRKMMKKITIVAQLDKVPMPPAAMQGLSSPAGGRSVESSRGFASERGGSLSSRFGANYER